MKKIINLKNTKIIILAVALIVFVGLIIDVRNFSLEPVEQLRVVEKEKGVKIIAFGDSLTAGYGLIISESYPSQLESNLRLQGLNVTVINSGVSGETTRGNLERAEFIRNQKPDIVLLGIGGNDALRLLPVEETKNNIESTIQILQSGENPPIIILLKMQAPINVGTDYKESFDMIYQELATKYNLLLLPFMTSEVFLDSENKLPDGIHLNKKGYEKVVNLYLADKISEIIREKF